MIEMVLGTDTMTKHAAHLSALHSIVEKQRATYSEPEATLTLEYACAPFVQAYAHACCFVNLRAI